MIDPKLAKVESVIAALKRVVAGSDEVDFLLSALESNHNTEEFFLSKDGDEEWGYYLSELDEDEEPDSRETWAKDQDDFYRDFGYPTHYFSSAQQVPEGTWLAHFTDSDPDTIVNKGFQGREFDVLGLTTHYKDGAASGQYAFAFEADAIQTGRYHRDFGFGKYGKNLILFKAKEAVKAYHSGDEEYQVIFVVDTAYDLHPVWGDSDQMTVYKGGEEFICDRDQECVENVIDFLEKVSITPT